MTVEMERETAKELISFKLQHLQETMRSILEKWGEENCDDFANKARRGILENAEMDAISIRQLVADFERLQALLESIMSKSVRSEDLEKILRKPAEVNLNFTTVILGKCHFRKHLLDITTR